MRPDRSRVATIAFAALLLPAGVLSAGGRKPLPPPGTPPPAAEVPEADPLAGYPDLLLLPGRPVDVRYVPDSLDRAASVQKRLEVIAATLEPIADRPFPLRGVILDREAWEKAGLGVPWGLPARTGSSVFATGADGDAEMVRRIRSLTGGWLPELSGVPMRGTPEGASALEVSDALLELEVARGFLEYEGLRASDPWVGALLDQVAARLAWEATDPGGMPALADLFDRMAAVQGGTPRLADYRRDLSTEEDLRFQSRFLRGADVVWVEKGARGSRRWLKKLVREGAPVTRAAVEKEFPGLVAWERDSFQP
jgi:hypothetical protein